MDVDFYFLALFESVEQSFEVEGYNVIGMVGAFAAHGDLHTVILLVQEDDGGLTIGTLAF